LAVGAAPLALLIALIAFAAAASTRWKPHPLVVAWLAALTVFACLAARNVTVALLLATPYLLVAAGHCVAPRVLQRTASQSRSSLPPLGVAVVFLVIAVPGIVVAQQAATPSWTPEREYDVLTQQPGNRIVFNNYNLGGQVLWYTDQPRIQPVVDGRADRYGPEFLTRYFGALNGTAPNPQQTVLDMGATDALLAIDDPLYPILESHGWTETSKSPHFVLLQAPVNPGSQTLSRSTKPAENNNR
jgi:hypothetical protein